MNIKLGQVWKINYEGSKKNYISLGIIENFCNIIGFGPCIIFHVLAGKGYECIHRDNLSKCYDLVSEPKQIQVPGLESGGIKFLVLDDHRLQKVFEWI